MYRMAHFKTRRETGCLFSLFVTVESNCVLYRIDICFSVRAMWAYVFAFIRFDTFQYELIDVYSVQVYTLLWSMSRWIEVYCLFVARKNNWPLVLFFLVTPFVCLFDKSFVCYNASLNCVWVLVFNWMWNKQQGNARDRWFTLSSTFTKYISSESHKFCLCSIKLKCKL